MPERNFPTSPELGRYIQSCHFINWTMNLFTDAKIGILLETMVDIEIFVTFDVSY